LKKRWFLCVEEGGECFSKFIFTEQFLFSSKVIIIRETENKTRDMMGWFGFAGRWNNKRVNKMYETIIIE